MKNMKIFLKWLSVYIPSIVLSFIVFYFSAWTGFVTNSWLILAFGVFIFPMVIFSVFTFLFLKFTRNEDILITTKYILSLYWLPILVIANLLLLTGSLIPLLILVFIIGIIMVVLKNRKAKQSGF